MNTDVLITLLSIAVILLSIMMIALLAIMVVVLVKVRQVMKRADIVVNNLASATEWLAPAKVFAYISKLFRK